MINLFFNMVNFIGKIFSFLLVVSIIPTTASYIKSSVTSPEINSIFFSVYYLLMIFAAIKNIIKATCYTLVFECFSLVISALSLIIIYESNKELYNRMYSIGFEKMSNNDFEELVITMANDLEKITFVNGVENIINFYTNNIFIFNVYFMLFVFFYILRYYVIIYFSKKQTLKV